MFFFHHLWFLFFLRVATIVCRSSNACVQIRGRLSFEFYRLLVWKREGGGRGKGGWFRNTGSAESALFYGEHVHNWFDSKRILSRCFGLYSISCKIVSLV